MSKTLEFKIYATTIICKRIFIIEIQKNNDKFAIHTEYKFNQDIKINDFLVDFCKAANICKDVDINIIPKCLDKELKSFTADIIIPDKSKEDATVQDINTEITLELTIGANEKITFTIEKKEDSAPKKDVQNDDVQSKLQEDDKSVYWTLIYGPEKKDQQKDTDNDSGINVGELIDSFCEGVLDLVGYDKVSLPQFIKDFTITGFTATNKPKKDSKLEKINQDDLSTKENFIDITINTNLGNVEVQSPAEKSNEEQSKNEKQNDPTPGKTERTWSIKYENNTKVDILNIPVVGKLVNCISPDINTTITDFNVKVTKSDQKALTLTLGCNAFDDKFDVSLPLSSKQSQSQQESQMPRNIRLKNDKPSGLAFHGTAVWKKFDKPKKILILTIPKIGLGLDDSGHIAILLDASLNVSPLTFTLIDAGVGVTLASTPGIVPYLSGFGVAFNNGVLSIGGSLSLHKDSNGNDENNEYLGTLLINFKEIGLTAMGCYTQGSMWAYLTLQAPIGGVPAFFIKGLAAGFGYNRRLILPSIEEVSEYPLIKAAKNPSDVTQNDLNNIIKQENGQYFLAAGIKFTSFKIIDGFLLATVSFGNDCEIGLLGLADITVPPNMNGKKCLAKAELAIKSSIKPAEGIFSAEAQLTNESFVLTKECKLMGGFAAYAWFGKNTHSGDFVVTLGGYHPAYEKPQHYPVVPRLGLNWQVSPNISIIGEMYFALTPSILMAGGKLCGTYAQGDLKAWFIAYADILMNWKPFKYDVAMGVTLGASYTVNLLFVKKTFSVELGANLYLWGPKLHGKIDVSWYIISFSIYFEEDGEDKPEKLYWDGFIDSFLTVPSNEEEKNIKANKHTLQNDGIDSRSEDILTISLEGVIEKTKAKINDIETELDIVLPNQLSISSISKIPTEANARPVEDNPIVNSTIRVIVEKLDDCDPTTVFDSDEKESGFEDIQQKIPAALWGEGQGNTLDEKEVVLTKTCGKKLSIKDKSKLTPEALFPYGERWILLSDLYNKSNINFNDSFIFLEDKDINPEIFDNSIIELQINENNGIAKTRNEFLKKQKKTISEDISINDFVKDADNLLSEEIVIIEE